MVKIMLLKIFLLILYIDFSAVSTLPIISKPLDTSPDHLVWDVISADAQNNDPNKVRKIPKSIFITPNFNLSVKSPCPPNSKLGLDGKCLQTVTIDKTEILKQQIQTYLKANQTTNPPPDVDYEYDDEDEDSVGGSTGSEIYAVPPLILEFSDERRPPPYPSRIVQQDMKTRLPTATDNIRIKEPFLAPIDTFTQWQPEINTVVSSTTGEAESSVTYTSSARTAATATATAATTHKNGIHPTPVDRILFSSISTPNSNRNDFHTQNLEYNHEYATGFSTNDPKMTETVPTKNDMTTVLASTATGSQTVNDEKATQDANTNTNINPAHTNPEEKTSGRIASYEVLPLTVNTPKSTLSTTQTTFDKKKLSSTVSVSTTGDGRSTVQQEVSTTVLDNASMETSPDIKSNSESVHTSTNLPHISSELPKSSSESDVLSSMQNDDGRTVSTKETTIVNEPTTTHKLLEYTNSPTLDSRSKPTDTTMITESSSLAHTILPSRSLTSSSSSLEGISTVTSDSSRKPPQMEHVYEVEKIDKATPEHGEDVEIMEKIDKIIDEDDDYTDDNKNLTSLIEEELFLQGNGMILANYGNDNQDDHINSNISEIDYTVNGSSQSPSSSLSITTPTPLSVGVLDVKSTYDHREVTENTPKVDSPILANAKPTVYTTFVDALASSSSLFNLNTQLNPLTQRFTLERSTLGSEHYTQNPSETATVNIQSTSPVSTKSTVTSTSSDTSPNKLFDNPKHSTIDNDDSDGDENDDDENDDDYGGKEGEHTDGGSVTDDELNNSDKTIRLGINCYLKNYLKHFYIMCT